MVIALWIIGLAMAYCFVGGLGASRHHAVMSRKCEYDNCFKGSWCSHLYASVWLAGIVWPIGLPAMAGALMGSAGTGESRADKRHARELLEANHKVALAKLRAEETKALEQALES